MIRRVAEYTVREGELEVVLQAVRRFVAEVRAAEPRTRYEAYRRGETRSFLHFMAFPDAAAEQAHREAGYTAEFVEVLYSRCEEEPRFSEVVQVG